MTYALSDHRRYVCAGAAGSTGAAGDAAVWWSRSGSLTVPAWALVVAALVAIAESAASAPVVTGAVLAVVAARFGYRAVLRRMGPRRVHRLTIDLDPGYHAELRRQASEATDGSVTDLIREALALHRYVWEHQDAELVTRTSAEDPVVCLTLRRPRRCSWSLIGAAGRRRWPRWLAWSPLPPRRPVGVGVGSGDRQ